MQGRRHKLKDTRCLIPGRRLKELTPRTGRRVRRVALCFNVRKKTVKNSIQSLVDAVCAPGELFANFKNFNYASRRERSNLLQHWGSYSGSQFAARGLGDCASRPIPVFSKNRHWGLFCETDQVIPQPGIATIRSTHKTTCSTIHFATFHAAFIFCQD